MYKYLLHLILLVPAVFVAALIPQNHVPLSSSVTSAAIVPNELTGNRTIQISVPSTEATSGTILNSNSDSLLRGANEVVEWRNGLVAYFAAPPSERAMGYDRLTGILLDAIIQVNRKPASHYPRAGSGFGVEHAGDDFYIRNVGQTRRPNDLTYGDVGDFIFDVLLPYVYRTQAAGQPQTEFTWEIRLMAPPESWRIAEGAVFPRGSSRQPPRPWALKWAART